MEIRSYPLQVDPGGLLNAFCSQPGCFLLESSLRHPQRGRYSYLGCDPFLVFKGSDLKAFANLEKRYQKFFYQARSPLTPFSSGIVGYLSYDFGLQFERIKNCPQQADSPGFLFGFYDCVLTVDHLKKKLIVSSTGFPERDSLLRKKRAQARLRQIEKILGDLSAQKISRGQRRRESFYFKSNFTKAGYYAAVKKALAYIKRGDIYQVNLAQEFSCQLKHPVDAVRIYQKLRALSPSCFGGYFDSGFSQIVSSSPELFLYLQNGAVETRPMKGTRPRGRTRPEDRRQSLELWKNPKEKAELLMVTDLERNDLGRVCNFGSVKVKQLREIEKYRTVYQTTSTVRGILLKNKNGFDLIKACFPSGSITGCPKIRSMQVIEEIEPVSRGIYTGALGYMSFNGNMALNVLIRTLCVQGNKVRFHVGGGIVADSHPQAEYAETLVKAQALKESLKYA